MLRLNAGLPTSSKSWINATSKVILLCFQALHCSSGTVCYTTHLLVLTSYDQLIFILKILFSFVTKQAILMKSPIVPIDPLQ